MMSELLAFFRDGGPFMIVNLLFLGVAFVVIIERTVTVVFRLSLDARSFMDQVQKLVLSDDLEHAIKLCSAAPSAALPRVIKAGLQGARLGPREVARSLEEAVIEATPLVSRRIGALWSLANIATLVGLIGTITGLIGTFKSLGAVSPEMKQLMLSRGISEAMNNTAFGLVIAVTCIVAHLLLTSKSRAMVEEIEFHALRLENMLARRAAAEQPSAASGR